MAGKGRTPLCPQQVGAIRTMVDNKKSNGAIATALGIPKTTVSYHAANARRTAATARQDNRGRPKLRSPRELRGLRRVMDDNPFASMAEIAEKVNEGRTSTAGGPPLRKVSVSTVRRAIKGLGLSSCLFQEADGEHVPPSAGGGGSERIRHQVLMRFLQWKRTVATRQNKYQDLTVEVGK